MAAVEFEYDNRQRLRRETRRLVGTPNETLYDLNYSYDQLGNRLGSLDTVSGRRIEYTYDTQLEPEEMDYPTRNNRLLQYEVYEPDGQSGERLLRTVSYTYYMGGHVSNVSIKDEYHEGVTPGQPEDYEWVYDLALYYDTRSAPRLALWGRWQLDGQGNPDPDTYERSLAREFRYEWLFGELRARCLTIDYDPSPSNNPADWTLIEPVGLTDHIGVTPYQDAEVSSDGQGGWQPPSESVAQFFAVAQHTLATSETRYFHGDLIDSAVLATDDVGAGAATLAYSAFGEPIGDGESLGTRYRYAGGWGYESGLVGLPGANADLAPITLLHVGARWYQPDIGRFIQRDPIGIGGGFNVYLYALNNPLVGVDPFGLDTWITGGPWWARWFLNATGARRNWLLDNERRVRIASGIAAGVGIAAGGGALVLMCLPAVTQVVAVSAAGSTAYPGGVKLTVTIMDRGKQKIVDIIYGVGGGIKHGPHVKGPYPMPPLPPWLEF